MTVKQLELTTNLDAPTKRRKFDWYWALIYCAAWFGIFYAAAVPSFYAYPKTLTIHDESKHPDQFIGERAQRQLLALDAIGVKMTGTYENEVLTVNYLLSEINKIKAAARTDLYDIDVEVQYSSGNFQLWGMATSYRNVSNVIVKLAPKNRKSATYLLLNSHYDSEVLSSAAADDGVMVVIMLETLRVISRSERPLRNPIIFLLNGGEESNLLASHGFITGHRWAQYCKAVINLDSAGSGGREVLFQSGPNHPWLMKYYKQSVPHPYASTIGEELFENNFIPSDTDFRIFKQYGGVPGLDMAHTLNGYIYHTPYDTFYNLERGTYQTTGDNVLALTWALANAPELEHTDDFEEGHTVFYDYLGWLMIFYTETTGIVINITTSVCALIVIALSVFLMTLHKTSDAPNIVYLRFITICGVQLLTVVAAVGVTLLLALMIAAVGMSECWYSEEWLIFGLYFCPFFFVYCMLPAVYIRWTKEKTLMPRDHTIACFMHAHCIILAVVCLVMTGLNIRSAFFPMIAIFFYTISVILNMINARWGKKFLSLPIHLICQLLPYWFYTYLTFAFMKTFIPMQGRDGPDSKPELLIAGFSAIMSLHFSGFILPILHKFRKSKSIICLFGVTALIFIIIAATPVGFPFKKEVAAQRFYALHTTRTFYDDTGSAYRNVSGFYVQPVDTRPTTLDDTVFINASRVTADCESELYCGLPLYNSRWKDWSDSARWIEAPAPILPIPTEIVLTSKVYINETRVRYGFSLKSADRVVMYVEPYPNTTVADWSFDRTPLKEKYPTPYFIYHIYSMDSRPLEFWIEMDRGSPTYEGPAMRLGIGAHFLYHAHAFTEDFKEFLKSFPDWTIPLHWVASFESHHY